MRRDLSLPQQAVQACHACIESARILLPLGLVHPHLVLLGARSQIDLESIAARLDAHRIQFRQFHEPDLAGEMTALATEVISGTRRSLFKRYRCWTGDDVQCQQTKANDSKQTNLTR